MARQNRWNVFEWFSTIAGMGLIILVCFVTVRMKQQKGNAQIDPRSRYVIKVDPPTANQQVVTESELLDESVRMIVSPAARTLTLEKALDHYVISCDGVSEKMMIQAPEGVKVALAGDGRGVTFYREQKVVLVLVNDRFTDSGFMWILRGTIHDKDRKWYTWSDSQSLNKDGLTRVHLQKEINSL